MRRLKSSQGALQIKFDHKEGYTHSYWGKNSTTPPIILDTAVSRLCVNIPDQEGGTGRSH